MRKIAAIAVAWLVILHGIAAAQVVNPAIGTWKLNAAKSKFNAGMPNKSGTTKIEAAGAGVKVTVDGVAADGAIRHWTFTTNYDGKDDSVTGNSPYGDVVAVVRVDADTMRSVYKSGGKPAAIQTSVVAADGKTRTVTSKGTDADGQPIDNVLIYERQ